MSEESKIVVPDDETIPEKFRGKPVDEVIKSYQSAEQKMYQDAQAAEDALTQAQDAQAELRILKEQLQSAAQAQQAEPEPEDDTDFEYISKGELNKTMKQIQDQISKLATTITEKEKVLKEETANQIAWNTERQQFLKEHPELDGNDANELAVYGAGQGANTLEEAHKLFLAKAGKMGMKVDAESPRVIPSNLQGHMPQDVKGQNRPFDKDWVNRAKNSYSGIGATLKK